MGGNMMEVGITGLGRDINSFTMKRLALVLAAD